MSRPSAPTRSRRLCRTLTFSLLLAPALLSAQQAVLTGRVSGTGSEGLADSRVMLVNTSTVTQTNSEGRYTIRNVPTGTIEVRVIRVGYAEQKKSVVVAPGASITLDFALTALVVQLQEVVTTATGEQRKVEIGNALSTISAPQAVEQTAVSNIADLLVAKAPGVIMSPPNMSGSAPVIRIRGLNSLSLGNAPIMIVDGVRFFSSSISPGVGGTNESFMNSLSPEEIEDIEIVKGPSAATLYGTDAANGVIVVTTKKGRAGAARWNWFASTQQVEDRNKYPATYALWGHNPATGKITRCELATMSATTCVVDSTTSFDLSTTPGITPIANGLNTNFGGQVSGGNDAVRYFASGDLFNEVGPYKMPGFAQEWLQDSAQSSVRDEWVHPEAFQRQNKLWSLNISQGRYTVGDSVDATGVVKNALPFASAGDPRVPVTNTKKVGFDGTTGLFDQQISAQRSDPVPLASGIDARLIEAEAKLNAGDYAGMMTILNALRTSGQTIGNLKVSAMAALATTPTVKDSAVTLFFREKAFWTFGRGQRLPDDRRQIRQYGRTQDQVFPVGSFFKGSSYGTDVNFPVTDNEKTNPNFKGCTDRNA